jgi:hypothetical protein
MSTGSTLKMLGSLYKWDSPVTISTSDVTMEGGSNQIPKITYTEDDGTAALTLSTGAESNIARVTLRKFRIFGFANGTGTETDGTGISMIDAAYCLLEDVYIEGYRNAGGTGKGLAIYGHNKNTFNRLDIRWCDYGVYTGPNPNTHTTVDMDLFHFEDCIFGGNPDTGGDAGVCVYIDSNYNNNLSFTGQTEFSSCKTGVYLDAAISPNFNQFLIQGGRFEYTTAVAGGRFLDISPSSGNINNLSIKDFYSPYPIELGGSIGYVTLDNVYLGTDDVGNTTEALITGTTVGPGTVRNSRIVDGYTINGNIIYKKWWGSATKIEEMLWVQAADTNNYEFHNGFQIVQSGESDHGGLNINSYGASADIEADASTTIPVAVPQYAKIIGAQLKVKVALAAGETWDAAYSGGSTQAIASNKAVAIDTPANQHYDVNTDTDIASATTNIAITKNGGGNFTAQGTIEAVVYAFVHEAWTAE